MSRKHVEGFTLVELLVVIGIIALLISVLLPALGRAQDMAATVKCQTQLRQFGNINMNYVTDYKGFLFPTSFPQWTDPATSITYGGAGADKVLARYVTNVDKGRTIWVCPSAARYITNTTQFPLTYGFNQGIHPIVSVDDPITGVFLYWKDGAAGNAKKYTLKKFGQIRRASEIVQMADASLSSGAWTTTGQLTYTASDVTEMWKRSQSEQPINQLGGWSWTPNIDKGGTNYHMRYRHNGDHYGAVLFVDGHVELGLYTDQAHPNGGLKNRNFATGY